MRKHLFRIGLVLLCLTLIVSSSLAWTVKTHQKIASDAIRLITDNSIRKLLSDNKLEILRGSTAPDTEFRDFINHVYHIHDDYGNAPDKTAEEVKLIEKMIQEKKPFSEIAFELGVISHYLSDIHVPLHTDEEPNESDYHSKYETDVEQHLSQIPVRYNVLLTVDDPKEFAIAIAKWSNEYYDAIKNAYRDGQEYDDVHNVASETYEKAVYNTACLWYTLLSEKSLVNESKSEPKPESKPESQQYCASRKSDVFHYCWCKYVKKIKSSNLLYFNSRQEAINAGYRPCKVCNP